MTTRSIGDAQQVTTTKDGRYYVWKDDRYYSVTTLINGGIPKPALINWAAKFTAEYAVDNIDATYAIMKKGERQAAVDYLKGARFRESERAMNLGTLIHETIEAKVLDKPWPEWTDEQRPFMEQWLEWETEFNPTFIAAEVAVFNRTERYAGTLDAIATIPGLGTCLIDWKTGKGVYPEVGLQLAAYKHSDTFLGLADGSESPMPEIDGCYVLHLRPKSWKFLPIRADEEVFRTFLYVREVFRFSKDISQSVIGAPVTQVEREQT